MTILCSKHEDLVQISSLGKSSVTLRGETEWVVLVSSGWNRQAGSDAELISDLIESFPAVAEVPGFYGRECRKRSR